MSNCENRRNGRNGRDGRDGRNVVCSDLPGGAILKSKTVDLVDGNITFNIIGTNRTKLAEISIDTSNLNNPTILVMFSGRYTPLAAIHAGAKIVLYKKTGRRDEDLLMYHPLRAIQLNPDDENFVLTSDNFSYHYTDAAGNNGVSDVCDENSGIVRYALYLEKGPDLTLDGDIEDLTLAALAIEKN